MPSERRYHLSDLSPEQRSLQGKIASNLRWAYEPDRVEATAPARRGFERRFETLVDPEGVLDPRDRAIRAEAARRAHFLRMAAKSAAVRRAKSAQRRKPPARRGATPPDPDGAAA